jgi:hypothetical protein
MLVTILANQIALFQHKAMILTDHMIDKWKRLLSLAAKPYAYVAELGYVDGTWDDCTKSRLE